MGEEAKLIGERGEDIIEYVFQELLGYPHYRKSLKIPCSFEEDHKKKEKSPRTTHGVDGLISYQSNLKDQCLEIGVIESKFKKDPYPNNPRTLFRKYFKELAWTLQCFNHSDFLSEIQSNESGVTETEITGILFWLTNRSNDNDDISNEIAKAEFGGDGLKFNKILFVDNARLYFLIKVLEPLKEKLGKENIDFVYPKTGFNNLPEHNKGFGQQFPIDFFAYDIIPMRLKNNNDVFLYLACRKNFDTTEFIKILSLAQSFNLLQATRKTLISFPDYNELENKDDVTRILASLSDSSFSSQVKIGSYNLDFRNF